jgi:hypothetical protein
MTWRDPLLISGNCLHGVASWVKIAGISENNRAAASSNPSISPSDQARCSPRSPRPLPNRPSKKTRCACRGAELCWSCNPTRVLIVGMLVNEPFDDKGWVFETKWDGFRLVTEKHYPRTSVSRNF